MQSVGLVHVAQAAVLAFSDLARNHGVQLDVFHGVAKCSPATVANCHIALDFNHRHLHENKIIPR
jgi:predicted amidohydrolase